MTNEFRKKAVELGKLMNNKKKNEGQTDFSYYGLYLLDYLRTNRFEQGTLRV